jgi:peptidyl-prolyl cis-trans isomerase SurA
MNSKIVAHLPAAALLVFATTITSLAAAAETTAAKNIAVKNTAPGKHAIVAVDYIVAVVNEDVITRFELDERLNRVTRQLERQKIPLPPRNILERQLLERLVVERSQLQYAAQTGMRVDDAQLDNAIQRIAQENKLSVEAFRAALEKDGVNFSKFREEIRNEIVLTRLREREVDNKISVTDGEIDNILSNQTAQPGQNNEYNLAHILITVPEQASPEQIQMKRARAEKVLAQLNAGADFGQLSATYSDAQDAMQGGVVGWRSAGQLPGLFLDTLAAMQPGAVSPILHSPSGFHILKLLDKRGKDVTLVVEQTHARHILVKTNEVVAESDARNRLLQLKERIDNGANFAELARLHSDDGSAAKGGDLGWLSPGDTVPEFEKAMNGLKANQLSAPVQSPFGWHLIQVLERRKQDVTKERLRMLARQAIRDRKSDENYQEWLRQLHDRAYVEYRLNDEAESK